MTGLTSVIGGYLGHVSLWLPIAALVLPLLVGLVTKKSTSSGFQGFLFSLLAALLGVGQAAVTSAQNHTAFAYGTALTAALIAWWSGQTAYLTLWKHKLTGWLQDLPPIKDKPKPTTYPSFATVLAAGGRAAATKNTVVIEPLALVDVPPRPVEAEPDPAANKPQA